MYFNLSLACLCLAAVLVSSSESVKVDGTPVQTEFREVKVITNIRDFLRSHPSVRVRSLKKEAGILRDQTVRYTLGARIKQDRLVAQSSDTDEYAAKKDVTIQLTYPETGVGSIINFVEIVCTQDSNDGNAYIVSGNIGQRHISIVVEANQTQKFSYSALFYGSD